jgi:integrase/recombinase XerD
MSESNPNDTDSNALRQVADAFDQTLDPLAEFESQFATLDLDPFEPFIEDILLAQDLHEDTRRNYRSVFGDWTEHMEQEGRHPACPSDTHVVRFIEWQLAPENDGGEDNHPRTVKGKLRKLNRAYEFWQDTAAFPHPQDYNPFKLAREKVNLDNPDANEHRRIPVSELREMMASVTHLRKKAIIGLQFKLGLRAGEVSNIQLGDISLENDEIQRHYPEMGSERRLEDRPNAIYVPSGNERPGNKSRRPRVLPLDDELRRLLVRYLLVRPENGEPWLFLSDKSHTKINKKTVNKVWKDAFHPEYAETEKYRPVTSHFGRHRFSTWWRVEQDMNRELVKYMRGDKPGSASAKSREAIDAYLHTYYEDIRDVYLENIYKIGI